jgi:hypothetical protein
MDHDVLVACFVGTRVLLCFMWGVCEGVVGESNLPYIGHSSIPPYKLIFFQNVYAFCKLVCECKKIISKHSTFCSCLVVSLNFEVCKPIFMKGKGEGKKKKKKT